MDFSWHYESEMGTNSFPLLRALGGKIGGLSWDEILVAVIIGSIATTIWWFIRSQLSAKPVKLEKGQRWCIWITIGLLGSVLSLLGIETAQYIATQLNEIRKGVSTGGSISLTAPANFACEITDNVSLMTGVPGFGASKDKTAIMFPLYVLNRGIGQSVAWRWKCTAELGSSNTPPLVTSASPYAIHQAVIFPGQTTVLEASKYLPQALFETPLGGGASKEGWVIFHFAGGLRRELSRPGVRYVIEFEDKQGNKTTNAWVVPVGYFPSD